MLNQMREYLSEGYVGRGTILKPQEMSIYKTEDKGWLGVSVADYIAYFFKLR